MSIFIPVDVSCPACRASVSFRVVESVNADRRPDLRAAILDRSFQAETCPKCQAVFRMPPELTYFDGGRRQWILVQPVQSAPRWPELEAGAQATFDRTYGAGAARAAQAIGRGLTVRIAFGWAALREKLLCVEHGLDDAALESMKIMLVRGLDDCPLADDTELRLVEVDGHTLVLAWLRGENEASLQVLRVPRSLHDDIVADTQAWAALRAEVAAGPFVDMERVLLAA